MSAEEEQTEQRIGLRRDSDRHILTPEEPVLLPHKRISELTYEEFKQYQKTFEIFDRNQDKKIGYKDLKKLYRLLGKKLPPYKLHTLMACAAGHRRSRRVEFDDFVNMSCTSYEQLTTALELATTVKEDQAGKNLFLMALGLNK